MEFLVDFIDPESRVFLTVNIWWSQFAPFWYSVSVWWTLLR